MDPLGLYISIPFCRSKCSYCNFASGVYPASYFERYVTRLHADLRSARSQAEFWGARLPERVDSIYLGGGTPSLLPPALLKRFFGSIHAEFLIARDAEITIECAPGQLPDDALSTMAECKVNRISFGVQSFVDKEAKQTGRLHTREIALQDLDRVRQAGISRVNIDLIAGLPGQARASWQESLHVLRDANPSHASVYMLEVDDDSRLGRELGSGGLRYYAPQVPSDDTIADMYIEASDFLNANSVNQYEISNFAASGAESSHNLKYWQRQQYLGLGLDAHSMLRDECGRALRFAATDQLDSFLDAPGWAQPQLLTPKEELDEAWFLGLRLTTGVNLVSLRDEFGEDAIHPFEPLIAELAAEGLLEASDDRVRLTMQGRLLSNDVFSRFMSEPVSA